jgi:16S rRNA (cytidine1402-2'-O)-methyltransferase
MNNLGLGKFYVVATPIGNMEDITFRAVRTLSEVDIIFAEDTRTTGHLLDKYSIRNKLVSYNSHNQQKRNIEILDLLKSGKNIALVSDAGTPGISDPGYSAVSFIRKYLEGVTLDALETDQVIVPVPGPSALTAFVSVLGIGTHVWTFFGFLPHKNGRQKLLKEIVQSKNSSIFYESTHRIEKCMQELDKIMSEGEVDREVVVGKEITKIHESILRGRPRDFLKMFNSNPAKKKGEFVVLVV